MSRPRLLDLFCGAGGAGMGYHRAGFDVVGVDSRPMPRYPFEFHQADALEFCREHGHEFDAIHASPPCQKYSATTRRVRHIPYPDLVAETRATLQTFGGLWVIENVAGAPLHYSVTLCGSSFGQNSWRHRLFECSQYFLAPACRHDKFPEPMNPYNSVSRKRNGITGTDAKWRGEVGVEWMTGDEASQAIPPAYTTYIGAQLLESIARKGVAV